MLHYSELLAIKLAHNFIVITNSNKGNGLFFKKPVDAFTGEKTGVAQLREGTRSQTHVG